MSAKSTWVVTGILCLLLLAPAVAQDGSAQDQPERGDATDESPSRPGQGDPAAAKDRNESRADNGTSHGNDTADAVRAELERRHALQEQADLAGAAAAYCREHPDEPRCQRLAERLEKFCTDHPQAAVCQPPQRADLARCLVPRMQLGADRPLRPSDAIDPALMDACCTDLSGANARITRTCLSLYHLRDIEVHQRLVRFDVLSDGMGFANHSVGGAPVLDWFHIESDEEAPMVRQDGARIRVLFGDEALVIHDNPTSLMTYRGDANVTLRFHELGTSQSRGQGMELMGRGYRAQLQGEAFQWDGDDLHVTGFESFAIRPIEAPAPRSAEVQKMRAQVDEGVTQRQVGAEVGLRGRDVEVLTYDEVNVTVDDLPDRVTRDSPIRVEVSAELEEGRTIVLDLDRDMIGPDELTVEDLVLRYYDVEYDNDTRHEVEVVFTKADSIEDVMDATDDGLQPEYWAIVDEDGVHVLVSVPHWSTHAITVAFEAALQPSVVAGIVAGAAGSLLAGVLLFAPRRKDEA